MVFNSAYALVQNHNAIALKILKKYDDACEKDEYNGVIEEMIQYMDTEIEKMHEKYKPQPKPDDDRGRGRGRGRGYGRGRGEYTRADPGVCFVCVYCGVY